MNREFHYWITGAVAYHSGFSEQDAQIIAYSSQYVDDNNICYEIEDEAGEKPYRNYISQTLNIFRPRNRLLRIYPIFHFVPGDPCSDSARRRDGKMHILNTTPNSNYAGELLEKAFRAEKHRLYRIGIATHAYADTRAHQNFVGWVDAFNYKPTKFELAAADGQSKKGGRRRQALQTVIECFSQIRFRPGMIGHAYYGHEPDLVSHCWKDARIVRPEVKNNVRFLDAAKNLYEQYRLYLSALGIEEHTPWPKLQDMLERAMFMGFGHSTGRVKEIRENYYQNELVPWLPSYNHEERSWFVEAIQTEVRLWPDTHNEWFTWLNFKKDRHFWKGDKEKTHWYQFQEAVKAHEKVGIKMLDPIFEQMGVNIEKA